METYAKGMNEEKNNKRKLHLTKVDTNSQIIENTENQLSELMALVARRLEEHKEATKTTECFVCVIVTRGKDINHQIKVDLETKAHEFIKLEHSSLKQRRVFQFNKETKNIFSPASD